MAIAIIPARSGSQRIPNKNIKEFRGKPMIRYAVEAAERSGLFGRIFVSTDSKDIAYKAQKPFLERPESLARDNIGTQEVIARAIVQINKEWNINIYASDIVCCIYPTTPLMAPEDLCRAYYELKANSRMNYAFSVGTKPLHDAGQFYFGYAGAFLSGEPLVSEKSFMVPISEDRVCDINFPADWDRALEMYDRLHGAN